MPASLLLLTVPILLGGVGLLAAVQGTLIHHHGGRTLHADLLNVIGEAPAPTDTYFPYLRDYPTLVVLTFTGLTVALAYRNCALMERFLPRLKANGLLFVRPHDLDASARALARANRRFRLIRRARPLVMAASAGVAALLMLSGRTGPTFGTLAPAGSAAEREAWSSQAYQGWWASLTGPHWLGAVTYFAGASFIVYVILKHNIIGICFVSFFAATGPLLRYRVDRRNRDGYFGWLIMRDLLATVFVSLTLSIVAFASMFILIPVNSAPWTLPFLVLYFVGVPSYVILPMRLLERAVDRYRQREITLTGDAFRRARADDTLPDAERLNLNALERQEILAIQQARPQLFRGRTIAVTASIYIIPVLTSTAQTVLSYLQVSH
ncbi:hypothetical protein KIH74_05705 [Kineosporia sp. J2-2]|uniref:Uncharacterized protein n=1 Tax=Kineosporia corallincola TaxID=2835133 RepID=A0ABS5TBG7_9ACTN|nr:hypothetical protein [Kineosporia corallincola]MBT0768409.1 hypothetical protein [Kineosporia corallincola]